MEIWFHVANVLYVVSYLVTDILWLRALAVLGGFSSLTWTLTAPAPSGTFIGWTLVYNTINVVQIARLWHERRPVRQKSEEQMLYAAAFRALTPREFQRLLAVGRWHEAPAGEVLIARGACPRRMLVLASGNAVVKVDSREVAMLQRRGRSPRAGPLRHVGHRGSRALARQAAAASRGTPTHPRQRSRRKGRQREGADMKDFGDVVTRLYVRLDGAQWVARLAVRIAIGLEFFGSGLGKLGKLSGLIQYFRSLGIPAPEIQAPFVASAELVCGILIAVGLATRPAALMLSGVMTVAIVTAAAPEKHIAANWHGLLEFFYLPEVLLFLLLAWLIFAGPGRASLDARLGARRRRKVELSLPAMAGAAAGHQVQRSATRTQSPQRYPSNASTLTR